eukprot:TRINITY_DN18780_c0_g1_i1.p1 TRINITY_DN18780_c0_g1~~TRINITY_DN18780_c0_g1_i1.p1  ORF type:complete len:284 (+),score=32.59 TRINITY_DN18780_c0_g1_i1:106-957(+)
MGNSFDEAGEPLSTPELCTDDNNLDECNGACEILLRSKTITHFSLTSSGLNKVDAEVLDKAIRVNKILKMLNLYYSLRNNEYAVMVANALKSNNTLEILNLRKNEVNEEGAKVIAEVLAINRTLIELNLSENKLGSTGTVYISEALKLNRKLEKLNLNNNYVKDEGAECISEALTINTNLKELNLSSNSIKKGIMAIFNMLEINKTLVELHIGYSQIGIEGVNYMIEVLKGNKTLRRLNLKLRNIGGLKVKELEDAAPNVEIIFKCSSLFYCCLLYTSDAADE